MCPGRLLLAMVSRWARAGTGFARDALNETTTVCDPTDIVVAEDANAEACGWAACISSRFAY